MQLIVNEKEAERLRAAARPDATTPGAAAPGSTGQPGVATADESF